MSDENNTIEAFPQWNDEVPPAVATEPVSEPVPESAFPSGSVNPYADLSAEAQLLASKLDTLIIEVQTIKAQQAATDSKVTWIGTNFQNLLNTVSNIGASGMGPMGLLKMLKGGA